MISATRLFRMFEGVWRINRVVAGSQSAYAVGIATFSTTGPGVLHYHERGELSGIGNFFKDYHYRLEDGSLNIYFTNGTLFHTLVNGRGEHLCGMDRYTLEYHFSPTDENTFCIQCTVSGPQKAYSITTDFIRVDGSTLNITEKIFK